MFVFVLAPLPLGSSDLSWICIWNVLLAISLLTADVSEVGREDFHLLLPFVATLGVVAGVATLQTLPNPPLGHPSEIWQVPADMFGISVPRRISMTVTGPWLGLGYPLLFALALIRAILLAAEARAAQHLLRILAWAGCLYALYGIVSQVVDPTTLLSRRKEAYLGFATGTFVNRNTAATFWGSSALLFLVPLLRFLHRRDHSAAPSSNRPLALLQHYLSSPQALAIGFGICAVATAMTGSRAGLLLSILSFLMAGALYLAPLRLGQFRRWGLLAAAAAAALMLLQLIGGVVAGRILSYGLIDEQRMASYRASLRIVMEHPWLGIGFGNFESVFPAYRLPEMGSIGIWDRAHSVPLELAVELGLPTAALIATVCVWYVYLLFKSSLRRKRDRYIPIVGAGVASLGLLHSCVDFSLQIPGYGVFFAAIVGCGLAQSLPSSLRKEHGKLAKFEL
jgi:hypothetical protein